MTGTVYLVGAGPGAADLLTIRALRVLRRADVVLVDRLVPAAVLEVVPPTAEVVDVGKVVGADHDESQRWIHELMVAHAARGATVVRLQGGDPMVLGRGGEELDHLRAAGVPFEVVPGVSSAVGVPAAVGLALTRRGLACGFAVVAGEALSESDWARYAAVDTLVVLMGVRRRVEIACHLVAAGRLPDEPVAFIERGTTPAERSVVATLADVAAGEVDVTAPAVWVIGDVVAAWGGAPSSAVEAGR